jgi:hypothetical protein
MITDFCDEPLEEAHTTLWGLEMFNIFLAAQFIKPVIKSESKYGSKEYRPGTYIFRLNADFRKRESLHRSVVAATEDCRVWQVVK